MTNNRITSEKLREILTYNPESGIFTWLDNVSHSSRAGKVAGTVTNSGYVQIRIRGDYYRSHRLAFLFMVGRWPAFQIDHVNGIRTDNRFSNLREAKCHENRSNTARPLTNKSGVKGVHWKLERSKWCARVTVQNRIVHVGYFDDLDSAKTAIRRVREKLHGQFANHG